MQDRRLSLPLTRDSVCMADDIGAPHEHLIDIARDADAAEIASTILKASCKSAPKWGPSLNLSYSPDRSIIFALSMVPVGANRDPTLSGQFGGDFRTLC